MIGSRTRGRSAPWSVRPVFADGRKWRRGAVGGVVGAVGLIVCCNVAAADTLSDVSLVNVPGSQASTTTPYAINNSGEIAGQYLDPAVGFRVFSLSGGAYSTVDPGPSVAVNGSYFASLNNSGQILGFANTSTPPDYGYYYVGKTSSTLSAFPPAGAVLPSTTSGFSAYNDNGAIAGEAGSQAFVSQAGVVSYIAPPGATSTVINAINDTGGVVGQFDPATPLNPLVNQEAFALVDGVYTTLLPPYAVFVEATGINDLGEAVGYFEEAPVTGPSGIQVTPTLGFSYKNGVYDEYQVAGAIETELFGINDSGQVVGVFGNEGGNANGFSALTAAPEPSAWALMMIGVFGVGLALRARTRPLGRAGSQA